MRRSMNYEELRFAKAWDLQVRGVERPLPPKPTLSDAGASRNSQPMSAPPRPRPTPQAKIPTPSSSGRSPNPAARHGRRFCTFLWTRLLLPCLRVLGRWAIRAGKALYRLGWACIVLAVLIRPCAAQRVPDTIRQVWPSYTDTASYQSRLSTLFGIHDLPQVTSLISGDTATGGPFQGLASEEADLGDSTGISPTPGTVEAGQASRVTGDAETDADEQASLSVQLVYRVFLVIMGAVLGTLLAMVWLERRASLHAQVDPALTAAAGDEEPIATRRDPYPVSPESHRVDLLPWESISSWGLETGSDALLALQALDLAGPPSLMRGTVHRPSISWLLGAATRQGPRDSNQDFSLSFQVGDFSFALLLDGAGGLPGGRDAARIAGLSGALELLRHLDRSGGEPPDYALWAEAGTIGARASLTALGARLRLSSFGDGYRTTMAVYVAGSAWAGFAHIGDGGGVLVSAGGAVRPLFEPMRDVRGRLAASLGPSAHGSVASCEFARRPGDLVLVGSDGVFDVASLKMPCVLLQKAAETEGDLDAALESLLEVFVGSGAITDNLTLVAVGTGDPTPRDRDFLVRLGKSCAAAPLPALTTNPDRTIEDDTPISTSTRHPASITGSSDSGDWRSS